MGVMKPMRIDRPRAVTLAANQKLRAVHPDFHVRRRGGDHIAYICCDKQKGVCIFSQKLQPVVEHINRLIGDEHLTDHISITSLYNILKVADGCGRTGGFSKMRWKCRSVKLDESIQEFERLRQDFRSSVLIGSENSFEISAA